MIFDYAVANDLAQFNPVMSIRLPKCLKQGKRVAPTDDQIKIILSNWGVDFGLFPAEASTRGGKGGMMTLWGYEGAWNRYCQAVELWEDGKPTLTAHNLRHGTATLMFELGVDELTAQHILGHSRVEITREIYTDLRAKQAQKSVKKFNAGMKKYCE